MKDETKEMLIAGGLVALLILSQLIVWGLLLAGAVLLVKWLW